MYGILNILCSIDSTHFCICGIVAFLNIISSKRAAVLRFDRLIGFELPSLGLEVRPLLEYRIQKNS